MRMRDYNRARWALYTTNCPLCDSLAAPNVKGVVRHIGLVISHLYASVGGVPAICNIHFAGAETWGKDTYKKEIIVKIKGRRKFKLREVQEKKTAQHLHEFDCIKDSYNEQNCKDKDAGDTSPLLLDEFLIPLSEPMCSCNNIIKASHCKQQLENARQEGDTALHLARHYRNLHWLKKVILNGDRKNTSWK